MTSMRSSSQKDLLQGTHSSCFFAVFVVLINAYQHFNYHEEHFEDIANAMMKKIMFALL